VYWGRSNKGKLGNSEQQDLGKSQNGGPPRQILGRGRDGHMLSRTHVGTIFAVEVDGVGKMSCGGSFAGSEWEDVGVLVYRAFKMLRTSVLKAGDCV
jgi:hypothetical protein